MHAPRFRTAAATAVALVALLVLAACGGSGGPDAGGETRTITHARGETEVPVAPRRLVVLEPVQLDTTTALGTVPAGAAVLSEATGVPDYLGPPAAGVTVVGTVAQPNLEAIARLGPDLIIGTESRHAAIYDQLSAIAPTVHMPDHLAPWMDNVRFVGRALGREADVEGLLTRYRDRCAQVAREFGTTGRTAQLIRTNQQQLSLYSPTSFAGSTLQCAGFTIPPRDFGGKVSVDLSPELVLQGRADQVFVTVVNADDPNPDTGLPPALTTVRAQFPQLHRVDQSLWISGVGPLGGMAVLDDIAQVLAAQRPS